MPAIAMRYGCHNKPRAHGYWARDRYIPDHPGTAPVDRWTYIVDSMSQGCRYDQAGTDTRCDGCRNPAKKEAEAP